jgi:hypothetical protein
MPVPKSLTLATACQTLHLITESDHVRKERSATNPGR